MPNIETVVGFAVNVPATGEKFTPAPAPREVLWLSPLDVNFSQNVIYPCFSDGREVDEAVKCINVTSTDARSVGEESKFDLLLEPPFPTIEAVRWCPKLRDGEGKPLLDEHGEERRGKEAMFTLDNRRLYALQRAAVARHPQSCGVSVAVISSSAERAKHVKKFRTRTNGLSITVSEWNGVGRDNARDFNAMRVWDWRSAVAREAEAGDNSGRAAAEAAAKGNCGSWEYLDNKGICRGPFSNEMMRQWWEHCMLPNDLQIRPYEVEAEATERSPFRLVSDVFDGASKPFAPGWSPTTSDQQAQWNSCAQCGRNRLEGWATRAGDWYCATCWKRWRTQES